MKKKKQTPDERVKFVQEKLDEGTDWKVLRQIQINRAFYSGLQWISWNNVNKRIFVPDLRPGEKRYTFNKIKPKITTLLAKLTKNRVVLEVHPDTNDDKRIEVAKAGYKFLKYQWSEDDMDGKSRRLKLHMLVDGFPVLKVYVDKNKGQDIPEQAVDEEMMGDMKELPTKTGKIVTLVVDQTRLKVDPTAESSEEIGWCVEETPVDIDEIYETYKVRVETEDIHMRQSFEFSMDSDTKKKYSNHAMVKEYWEWPCKQYPNGRKITVCGLKELDYNDNPGENPYIFFPMIPILGRAVADSVVKDMTTPQMSYNIKRTAEAKILEEMGNPMWTVPINTVDDEDITNEIGGILKYIPTNNAKPERVQGASVDAGWQNAMERDEADMEDISGAHEISQGATPRGNNTYGGLQLQVEQDETKLALAVHSYEEGIKKWGEKTLRLVQKHFPEEQQLSIMGENGEIDAFAFAGADLSGGEVVDVVPGSSMPTLKAVQDDKVLMMWDKGMFNDPKTGMPDTRRVVRMLGQSVASDYFDNVEAHENKAKMEQRQWEQTFADPQAVQALMQHAQVMKEFQNQAQEMALQGVDIAQLGVQPPPSPVKLPIVRDFYDHMVHLDCHNRFRLTDLYDKLPPELQTLVDQHCTEHEQYLMAPQIAQQQTQEEQMAAQSEEGDKQHQRQMEMKQADHAMNMQREGMKGQVALQQAAMRQPTGR